MHEQLHPVEICEKFHDYEGNPAMQAILVFPGKFYFDRSQQDIPFKIRVRWSDLSLADRLNIYLSWLYQEDNNLKGFVDE